MLIDYEGMAWHENNANNVWVDGTFTVLEELPVEPANHVYVPTWIIAFVDDPNPDDPDTFAIDIPEIVYLHHKIFPNMREAFFNFDCDVWEVIERG